MDLKTYNKNTKGCRYYIYFKSGLKNKLKTQEVDASQIFGQGYPLFKYVYIITSTSCIFNLLKKKHFFKCQKKTKTFHDGRKKQFL